MTSKFEMLLRGWLLVNKRAIIPEIEKILKGNTTPQHLDTIFNSTFSGVTQSYYPYTYHKFLNATKKERLLKNLYPDKY